MRGGLWGRFCQQQHSPPSPPALSRARARGAVKSLIPGQDLTRTVIPPWFLEPRSLLERWADVLMHPELLHGVAALATPLERLTAVPAEVAPESAAASLAVAKYIASVQDRACCLAISYQIDEREVENGGSPGPGGAFSKSRSENC